MPGLQKAEYESDDTEDQQDMWRIQHAVFQIYQGMHLPPVKEDIQKIADRYRSRYIENSMKHSCTSFDDLILSNGSCKKCANFYALTNTLIYQVIQHPYCRQYFRAI